tara:strand:+ start:1758 stop:2411 length:654 start_codon:yes stop_codon:yes gene_type:complete
MSIESNQDHFSEVIDITLYKYNSIDVKIWGLIQRDIENKRLTPDSYLISASKMQHYLNKWFHTEINRFQSVNEMSIHKEATSVYFIWQMLRNIKNLTWIKVTLNKNLTYNRIVNIDQIKTIKYNIKTIRGSLRLFDIFNTRDLNIANDVLDRCKLLSSDQMYKVLKLKSLMTVLDIYMSDDSANETFGIINAIIHKLEQYESDDPEILLITDRNSDI